MQQTDWLASLSSSLLLLLENGLQYLPRLIGFFTFLIVGWILARVSQAVISRLVSSLDLWLKITTIRSEIRHLGMEKPASEIMGKIVFWFVLLFFVAAATETLGLAVVSSLVSGISYYLPNVLAAALIGFGGFLVGNLARKGVSRATASAGIVYGELLARGTQALVLVVTLLIAIDQIGIRMEFLMILIALFFGTMLSGMALAFGLGAKTLVGNILASHYLQRIYRSGQTVKIGDVQGRILEVSATAVLLETSEGRVLMPAHEFSQKASTLLADGG